MKKIIIYLSLGMIFIFFILLISEGYQIIKVKGYQQQNFKCEYLYQEKAHARLIDNIWFCEDLEGNLKKI
ncbi:hypothetical protein HY357_02805 [Candidatus Roizmanbacteria bacterium]|nr:hypothetical protein [Candidatus Roizmanbacteria bacterium]